MGKRCLFCDELLNDKNCSVEHIIPNAFGGRLKSKEIFCKSCNNTMGNSIDIGLVNNFSFFTFLANPKTERPTNGKIEGTISDTKVFLHNGGKTTTKYQPKITKNTDGGIQISFKGYVTDNEDREKLYKQILKTINGVSKDKKYSIDEIGDVCKTKTIEHPLTLINPLFSLKDFILGYLKILLSFCVYKNKIDKIEILELFKNKNAERLEKYASFCNLNFLHKGRLCHRIYLVGDSSIQKLYGIISLYDVMPMVFTLNVCYKGKDFLEKYVYDILNQKEIFDEIFIQDLNLNKLFVCVNNKDLLTQMVENIHSTHYFMNFFIQKYEINEIGELIRDFLNLNNNLHKIFDEKIKEDLFDFFIKERAKNEKFLIIRDAVFVELSKTIIEILRENTKQEIKGYGNFSF